MRGCQAPAVAEQPVREEHSPEDAESTEPWAADRAPAADTDAQRADAGSPAHRAKPKAEGRPERPSAAVPPSDGAFLAEAGLADPVRAEAPSADPEGGPWRKRDLAGAVQAAAGAEDARAEGGSSGLRAGLDAGAPQEPHAAPGARRALKERPDWAPPGWLLLHWALLEWGPPAGRLGPQEWLPPGALPALEKAAA